MQLLQFVYCVGHALTDRGAFRQVLHDGRRAYDMASGACNGILAATLYGKALYKLDNYTEAKKVGREARAKVWSRW